MANSSAKKSSAKANGDDSNNGGNLISLLSKAVTPEFAWSDKDEFLDVIYWMRQILGVVLGLAWGIIPLKGFLGLALFLLVNVAVVYIYYNTFQKVDEEEYGGATEILKEGLMTSFSSFLVAWIILYSALHTESTL
ncbi:respirasome Complex Assembly Factor 1 [Aplysia californica]|uniref:Respirasome Complex Assembly Factor 1 n=1 Tax=Aplysia californica TaxID=6500 RepID=A0ABM0JVQ0_APLCA|nr:respirasome Complex Assembly Factor 1 [Aplysia californica]